MKITAGITRNTGNKERMFSKSKTGSVVPWCCGSFPCAPFSRWFQYADPDRKAGSNHATEIT